MRKTAPQAVGFLAILLAMNLAMNACTSAPIRQSAAFREDLCVKEGDPKDPVVLSISPTDGRRTGNTVVTIHGKNFQPGAAVMIGKARCAGVSHVDESTLTCRTSRHPSGRADVLIANPDRGCGFLPSAFTYAPATLIHPTSATLAAGNQYTFQAGRGVPPYAFEIVSGGGTITRDTGVFTAPGEAGTTVVKVTDSSGTQAEAVISVHGPLAINPPRYVMVNRSYELAASGGVPPYTFQPSETFEAPSEPGSETIAVEDSLGNRSEAVVEIHPDFEFVPTHQNLVVGERISVKGGAAPATFSILAGLGSVDPESGDFTASDTPGKVALRAQDAEGNRRDIQITVEPGLALYPMAKTLAVGDTLTFVASGGIPPYGFSLESTLERPGKLDPEKGNYVAAEMPGSEIVKVTDSRGTSIDAQLTIGSAEGQLLQKIVSGHSHRCVLLNGGVKCWGANNRMQLGSGTSRKREALPVPVEGLTTGVLSLASGLNHTCALLTAGGVKCWGDNSYGQLGNGDTRNSAKPVKVVGLFSGVQAIAAGAYHTCAITSGSLLCWGDNRRGQLGNGSTLVSSVPVQVKWLTNDVQLVAAGTFHTCAVAKGTAQCWGFNFSGQLGDGTVADRLTPAPVRGLQSGVRLLALGDFHSCAVVNDEVQCWGYNGSGQLGALPQRNGLVPRKVPLPEAPMALALGSYHSCALLQSKSVQCWGYNHEGQAVPNGDVKIVAPRSVPFAQGADDIATAANHSCAVLGNKVRCWGFNGQTRFTDDWMELR